MVIAIDPGNENSALVEWDGERIVSKLYAANGEVLEHLKQREHDAANAGARCVIEMIGHYGTGMPAGKTIFDTCVWIGRFMEAYGPERVELILRPTVKAHICGSARAKDGNVRQAILDRFGGKEKAIGKKASPGALYGLSGDIWQAFAVALTWWDQRGAHWGAAEAAGSGLDQLKARLDAMAERKREVEQGDMDFGGRVQ